MSRVAQRWSLWITVALAAVLLVLTAFAGDGGTALPRAADAEPETATASHGGSGGVARQDDLASVQRRAVLVEAVVTVVDSDGQAVPGADVIAIAASADSTGGVREGRTGPDGIAGLTLPTTAQPWRILVNWRERTHERLARGAVELQARGPERAHCRVELLRLDARLEVTVIDDARVPVAGAVVGTNYEALQQITGRAGTARFAALPVGSRPIDVRWGPEARADVVFPPDCRQMATLERDRTTYLTFVVPRRASLEVRLAAAGLDRAAVIEVLAADGGLRRELAIEPAGAARFEGLPPGEYTVAARFGDDAPWDASERQPVALGAGEQRVHVVQARRLDGVLRGAVVDARLQPVAGAVVCVRSPARAGAPALEKRVAADAAGRFSVAGLATGTVECAVLVEAIAGRDFQYLGGDVPWLAMPCPDERVVLRLQDSPGVRGRVVDERGVPIRGQTVHLQREGFPVDRRVVTAAGDGAAAEPAAGSFLFRHVMPGTYRLWVAEGDRRVEREIVVGEPTNAPAALHELRLRRGS